MIDSDLISIIDLKESILVIDVYSNPILSTLFEFFYIINQYELKYFVIEFIFKILYFLQFFFISNIWIPDEKIKSDIVLNMINKIKTYIFVQNIIDSKSKFIFAFIICFIFSIIIVVLIIIILKKKRKTNKRIIQFYNYINLFFINYFLCFEINIILIPLHCDQYKILFSQSKCYNSIRHILILILCILQIIFLIIYLFLISKFIGTISNMKGMNIYSKTKSNYDIYANIFCIICYFLAHLLFIYGKEHIFLRRLFRLICMIGCFLISLYLYKKVFFYNEKMNILYLCGWTFSMWYYLGLTIKGLLEFKELFFFIISGWILIGFIFHICSKYQYDHSLTTINVFEAKSIKDVEIFIQNLLRILNNESEHNTILLIGLNLYFQDYFKDKSQLYQIYEQLISNKYLIKKYGEGNIILETYGLIYVLLTSLVEKLKEDAILVLCAFLINELKNYNLAMYHCSKQKMKGYYNNYIKYSLIEDTKNIIVKKFENNTNLDNINKVQIENIILYYQEMYNLKIKIYDAACLQAEYFDILKNNNNSNKIVSHFLDTGCSLLKVKKEITNIWNKIISINPFNEEIKRDYMLYLRSIIQDDKLANKEESRFNRIKHSQFIEKDKIYYSFFNKENSSVILIDGNSNNGKILYTSPNFYNLFGYYSKEVYLLTVNDLIPKYIASFHREVVVDAIKYSNIKMIFNKLRNLLLKGKNNEIYDINGFFKLIPDLSHGPIYIGVLQKLKDKDFLIVLDKDLKIDSMTTSIYNDEIESILFNFDKYPFGLTNKIIGKHISTIIPSIIPLILFQNSEFIIKKTDIDFKGILYSEFYDINYFISKIESIIEKIKKGEKMEKDVDKEKLLLKKSFLFDEHNKNDGINKDYKNLIDDYKKYCKGNNHFISFKITKHSFINDKYCYYRVSINKDIFSEFENKKKINTTNQTSSKLYQSFNYEIKIGDKRNIKILYEENSKFNSSINKQIKNKKSNEKKVIEDGKSKKKKQKNIEEEQQPLNISFQSNNSKKFKSNLQFQDIKLKIANKVTPKFILIMRIFTILFSIGTLILIIYNNSSMKSKFELIKIYLDQNYFFNHSIVALSSIYYSSLNLKLMKYNIMGSNGCIGKYHCINNYIQIIFRDANYLEESLDQALALDEDYKKIVYKKINLEIYASNEYNKTNYDGTIIDILYLILVISKKISSNAEQYVYSNETNFDLYIENILSYCNLFLENAKGLNDSEKRVNAKKPKYLSNKIYMIINIIIYFLYLIGFYVLVLKFFRIESTIITNLIKFHCNSFEKYIKFLEELKKKLKNDSNEEENIISNHSNTNNESEDNKNEIENNKEKENKKKNKKSKKNQSKLSKSYLQKIDKIKIFKKYFLNYNILFSFNISFLCLIIMGYYALIYILYYYRRKHFFELDDFMASVEAIYPSLNIVFLKIKKETNYFTNFIIEKNQKLKELNSKDSITFQNIIYTKENYTLLENKKYVFNIPDDSQIEILKLGTLITSYTANTDISVNNSKTVLANLYNGNACDVIYKIYYVNNEKNNECLEFWSSFVSQGIEQCLSQIEIEILNIIEFFKKANNSDEVLSNLTYLETIISNCEEFIIYYFYYAYQITILLFIDLESDYRASILFVFDIIVLFFIIGCFLIFLFINIIIYYKAQEFGYLINFILIFPFRYLEEEETLYNEILYIRQLLYK